MFFETYSWLVGILIMNMTAGSTNSVDGNHFSYVNWRPKILGALSLFPGTRIPVENLYAYLAGGFTVEEFRADFPTVRTEQIASLLGNAIARN